MTPDNQDEYLAQMRRFNLGCLGEADCPVFDGLFEYCQVGIMLAARALILGSADKAFLLHADLHWGLSEQCCPHE